MLAAPALDPDLLSAPRRNRIPLLLSGLLHLVLLLVWLGFPNAEHKREPEQAFEVELAASPTPPSPAGRPQPVEAPKPQPATESGAPIPQLEDGVLAQRSSMPKPKVAADDKPAPQAVAATKPKKPEPVTQNERDFVLGQVIRHWHPPRELGAYDKADIRVSVVVRADGYFDDIYDARRPWNPGAVFDGYGSLRPDDIQRRTVDAFYQAIRQAQPVRLPPALQTKAPFPVRLDFRFKDAR